MVNHRESGFDFIVSFKEWRFACQKHPKNAQLHEKISTSLWTNQGSVLLRWVVLHRMKGCIGLCCFATIEVVFTSLYS